MNHSQVVDIISEFHPPAMFVEEYDSIANFSQLDYMNKCVEEKNLTALLPFETGMGVDDDTPPLNVSILGLAPLPKDYRPFLPFESLTYFYNGVQVVVEQLDHKILDYRKNHPTEVPTEEKPICCIHSDHVQFLPRNLRYVNFKYMKKPDTVHMNITTARGFAEYAPAGSVEFEWNDGDMVYIIQGMLNFMEIPATLDQINNLKNKKQ
jgi:hypothetical protein